MIKNLLLPCFLLACTALGAQFSPTASEKICLDKETQSVNSILTVDKDWLIAFDNFIIRRDASGNEKWRLKFQDRMMIDRVSIYGDNLIFVTYSTTTFEEKRYVVNIVDGKITESLNLDFGTMQIGNSAGKSGKIAAVISVNSNLNAVLINRNDGKIFKTFTRESVQKGFSVLPNFAVLSPDEKLFFTGTAGGNDGLIVYDAATATEKARFPGKGDIHSVQFSSDGKFCFFILDNKLKVLNTGSLKIEKEIALLEKGLKIALHPDNENLVITGFGTASSIEFVNWQKGLSKTAAFKTGGCHPAFNGNGDLMYPSMNGTQCLFNIDKSPYLSLMRFGNTNTVNSSNAELQRQQGERVFIRYSGDNKYYSGTITELTQNGYKVIFDDGTPSTVKSGDIKNLVELKAGQTVQCRASDKKFYWATVADIKGDAVFVKFNDGKTSGWFTKRDIMQVK